MARPPARLLMLMEKEEFSSPDSPNERPHRVPFVSFFAWTGGQFALAFLALWLIAPGVLSRELSQPWAIVLWTFLLGLPLSLFEYVYHRYLLHSAVLPFLGSMHRAHSTHHGLTAVKAPVRAKEPEFLVPVHNEFPVEEAHQEESMMFPVYSVSIFYGVFFILLALPLKLMFPGAPILASVILAVTLQYTGYEFWHAITHLPYERFWKPLMEGRRTGRISRRIYAFHLMHHWRPSCNLAVVGFWGFAIWDYAFRTHRRPKRLPVPGAEVSFADVALQRPLFPVSMLDRMSGAFYRGSRKIEAFAARVFLRRKSTPPGVP
jgi:hypothetical protein